MLDSTCTVPARLPHPFETWSTDSTLNLDAGLLHDVPHLPDCMATAAGLPPPTDVVARFQAGVGTGADLVVVSWRVHADAHDPTVGPAIRYVIRALSAGGAQGSATPTAEWSVSPSSGNATWVRAFVDASMLPAQVDYTFTVAAVYAEPAGVNPQSQPSAALSIYRTY